MLCILCCIRKYYYKKNHKLDNAIDFYAYQKQQGCQLSDTVARVQDYLARRQLEPSNKTTRTLYDDNSYRRKKKKKTWIAKKYNSKNSGLHN